jgi:hypothetical protein
VIAESTSGFESLVTLAGSRGVEIVLGSSVLGATLVLVTTISWSSRLRRAAEEARQGQLPSVVRENLGLGGFVREGRAVVVGGRRAVRDSIVLRATAGERWRFASSLTGIALILTFLVIGSTLKTLRLDSGSKRDASSAGGASTGAQRDTVKVDAKLADTGEDAVTSAVQQMGSKFWISACGVFATILYGWGTAFARRKLERDTDELLAPLGELVIDDTTWRELVRERERDERIAQNRRLHDELVSGQTAIFGALTRSNEQVSQFAAEVVAQRTELRGTLTAIDRHLNSLGASVIELRRETNAVANAVTTGTAPLIAVEENAKALRAAQGDVLSYLGSLDASVKGGLAPLADNVDRLANQLLGPHLDEAIQRLLSGIGNEFENKLEPLSLAIREQSPHGMMDQFLSVVTSGASVATTSFHGTMERMEALLPEMLERIRQAAVDAQRSNTEVYAALAAESERSEARLVRLNEAVTDSVSSVRTVVDALVEHAQGTLSAVAAQTNDAVGAMAASSRDVSKDLAIQVGDLVRSLRAEHEKAEERSADAREKVLQRQADATSQFIDDLQRQLSELGKLDQSRIASIRSFNQELNQVIASFAAERSTLENSTRELDRRAQALEAQQERVIELTNRTSVAGAQLERALEALAARAREDEKLVADTQTQVAQIRLRSEELEGALKRIATEVANAMNQELKLVNDQVAKNAQLVDQISARLGDKVVSALAETVDDLKAAVDGLLKTTVGQVPRR